MNKRVTAGELAASLRADPTWVAQRAEEEKRRQERRKELMRAQAPLLESLQDAGVHVETIGHLVNRRVSYPKAIPILLEPLGRPHPAAIRESIARSLAVPDARFAWPILVQAYRLERESGPKDGLAVAIAAIADKTVIEELIGLATDKTNGPSRLLLLRALSRSRTRNARQALVDLKDDQELEKEIRVILRRKRTRSGTS